MVNFNNIIILFIHNLINTITWKLEDIYKGIRLNSNRIPKYQSSIHIRLN